MGVSPACRRVKVCAALALLLAPMAPLQAAGIAGRHADAALALACFSCHDSTGRYGDAIPALDASRAQLRNALLAYKHDLNGTAVMNRISRGFSDDELDRIAAYVAGNAEARRGSR